MTDGRAGIDAGLVRRLIEEQFPRWSGLPIEPVPVDGWDNRTYRLGDDMSVRLPTAEGYASAVAKENEWLPRLAPQLKLPIPEVLGAGVPGCGYPYPWSVRAWIPGETALAAPVDDLVGFARQVAGFILDLQRCDATGGPGSGAHSWWRGGPPSYYDAQTRRSAAELGDSIDAGRALRIWAEALEAQWHGEPRWFHGDIAAGNLLVEDGALSAVIDFGTCGTGDPACDLVIAWNTFEGASRDAFREAVGQDGAMWARARGWALWKALIVLAASGGTDEPSRRVLAEVLG